MAYQALYRKYRPQTFSDVIGQEHITETLKNELSTNKLVHAYLFTGTRGTGKTSCAKILAKAVNCLSPVNGDPCGECEMCRAIAEGEITDICEIDAASNNGVENIRELREQVTFAPAAAKYRVYIIDEVHMLSLGAFNALLKTLEEPPAHVVFILATTEVHKLPATILSRCQRFDFRRIEPSRICERIQYIAQKEGLTVTDDAATLIASAADGGMRDALSILDLCASHGSQIDEDAVSKVCAMAGGDHLIKFADLIKARDTEGALMLIDQLHRSSVDMMRLLSELTSHYRDLMIVKTVKGGTRPIVCSGARMKMLEEQAAKYTIQEIMSALSRLQLTAAAMQSGNRRCEMEMAVIKLCCPDVCSDLAALEMRIAALESGAPQKAPAVQPAPPPAPSVSEDDDEIPLPDSPDTPPAAPDTVNEATPPMNTAANDGSITPVDDWCEVLSILRTTCPLIAGVLQGSSAYIKGQYLLIDAQNDQFRTLVNGNNPQFRDSIRKAAAQVLGGTYKLGPYKAVQKSAGDPMMQFAEVLKNLEKN